MKLKHSLQQYFELQRNIYKYFNYEEDWTVYPIDDQTDCYWQLQEDVIIFHDDYLDQEVINSGLFYQNALGTDVHLPKSVWEGEDYTMMLVDTQTDGNVFLAIFDNRKKIKDKLIID